MKVRIVARCLYCYENNNSRSDGGQTVPHRRPSLDGIEFSPRKIKGQHESFQRQSQARRFQSEKRRCEAGGPDFLMARCNSEKSGLEPTHPHSGHYVSFRQGSISFTVKVDSGP